MCSTDGGWENCYVEVEYIRIANLFFNSFIKMVNFLSIPDA
jgi:hypothetical protein